MKIEYSDNYITLHGTREPRWAFLPSEYIWLVFLSL